MFRAAFVGANALLLGACATQPPATVKGECQVFVAPNSVVHGVSRDDRLWIAETIEAGVYACGWARPKDAAK